MIRIRGSTRAFGLGTVNVAISRTQMGSQLRGNRVKKSKSGKLSDLTGDGKVTQADVLKGRGVFKKGGNVKKYQAGGRAQIDAANKADRLRKQLELREGRPARQEAEYQEAQQARREKGGIGKLAMIPEAIRRAQMRVGDRLLASSEARENAPLRAEVDAADREVTDTLGRMKKGGKVGMHKMPDGTMMKDSAHKMKAGGKVRGYGKARGGKPCKMM